MKTVAKPIAASLLAILAAASAPSPVLATGVMAGATEFTQISNNVQLVISYSKQLQQYKTQLDQFRTQLLALRQMDPSKLRGMLKGVGGLDGPGELERAFRDTERVTSLIQGVSQDMSVIYREGVMSVETAKRLAERGIKITPGDYVSAFRALGQQQQDTYGQRLRALNAASQNALSDIKRAQEIASASEAIQTNVEGFQSITQANAIMSSQLGTLTQVLTQQTTQDAENAQRMARKLTEEEIARMQSNQYMTEMFGTGTPGKSKQ